MGIHIYIYMYYVYNIVYVYYTYIYIVVLEGPVANRLINIYNSFKNVNYCCALAGGGVLLVETLRAGALTTGSAFNFFISGLRIGVLTTVAEGSKGSLWRTFNMHVNYHTWFTVCRYLYIYIYNESI